MDQSNQAEEPKGIALPEPPLRKKRGRPPKAKGKMRSLESRQATEATGPPESSPSINAASSSALKTYKAAKRAAATGTRQSARVRSMETRIAPESKTLKSFPVSKPRDKERGTKPKKKLWRREWGVEKILDSHIDRETYEHFYLVKWKGFASKDNTWEPKRHLKGCAAAVHTYEKVMTRRARQAR